MRRHVALFLALALTGAALDLLTKHLAFKHLHTGEEVQIVEGFFSYRQTTNPGVVFGLGPGAKPFWKWVAILAVPAILWIFFAVKKPKWILTISLGMILGGTIGNMVDRVFTEKQEVRDFIKFYYVRGDGSPEEIAQAKEDGSYGTCRTCEDRIGSWRLQQSPNALHCSRCREAVWPLFNLADSLICVGVFLLTLEMLFFDEKKRKQPVPAVSSAAAAKPPPSVPTPSNEKPSIEPSPPAGPVPGPGPVVEGK